MTRILIPVALFSFVTLGLKSDLDSLVEKKSFLDVKFNEKDGKFSIAIDDVKWFESSDLFVRDKNELFSTVDGRLKFHGSHVSEGQDKLGKYKKHALNYETTTHKLFEGSIRVYDDAIVFQQNFPQEMIDTSSNNADGLITGFPSFDIKESHGGQGYAHWISWFYQSDGMSALDGQGTLAEQQHRRALVAPGFSTPQFGKWNANTNMTGGIGGTGVLAVFDEHGNTAILSALTNPMATSHISANPGSLTYGIMGNVTNIPRDYSTEIIMVFGQHGVNAAMSDWGTKMRTFYNKPPASVARTKDLTLQYLGYTTDNGAYYYYHTEEGQNYEDTLVNVKKYADEQAIPYKYVLLDSWWYYKGSNGGVSNWTALPDVFPNGVEALYNRTGWKVQAHNRYWALDNHYSTTNGGDFEFIEDNVKNGAVPVGDAFWEHILTAPAKNWGLIVYEQDWLFNEFYEYVSPMLESVNLGRNWLLEMGRGAAKAGVTVQYCMPFIRHLMQSLEVPVATQARASDDYVTQPYTGVDNWRIGGQSLLIDALGMAPSKDGYWSTHYQANNPYGEERNEPYPRMQAAVTALSAGPVAIADGIGFSDADLIMRSCTKNGRLLQPTSPATIIDGQFLQSAIGGNIGPQGEVWFAPSIVDGTAYGALFVADLKVEWTLTPQDVGYDKHAELLVFESNTTDKVMKWSQEAPLVLQPCGLSDFALWTVIPTASSTTAKPHPAWTFLGETDKWVSISATRFERITHDHEGGVSVLAVGTAGEVLNVAFSSPSLEVKRVQCVVGASEKVAITSAGKCDSNL